MALKIVIVGAGSAIFGLNCIKDAFLTKELWGSELVLVDIDKPALKRIGEVAEKINREINAGYKISTAIKLNDALPNADFVITSIAVNRIELWKKDFEIPKKHGINHVLGENAGPGALFHSMRNIPIMIDICREMEKYCPEAYLLNYTNPESRLCLAINKYTNIKVIGLCHQIHAGIKIVAKIFSRDPNTINVKAWGLNHFSWIVEMTDKYTGENLYPLFRQKESDFNPSFEKLSRYVFHKFGLFPTSGDGHLGEFFPYAHEFMSTKGYDFLKYEKRKHLGLNYLENILKGSVPIDSDLLSPSGEKAFDIIKGITFNTNENIVSANILNDGYISNLPKDSVVEVPVVVNKKGIQGIKLGELPQGIAALCQAQINVQKLAVETGYTGDANLALQALLIDPNVPSANAAEEIFKELMQINKAYLPQFKQYYLNNI
ncbi:hypothetical protein ACJROX_28545 [Pseudalkalibacillus sp. A8]|uniref:family 4 glycosyl hydrolase n=1 Tax=Pseudalkalibacillus sp. A8 TaxID=3382641 RepID=UPI0038B6648E